MTQTLTLSLNLNYPPLFFIIKFVSLSWYLRLYHFYSLFTAYLLCEEVMSIRLHEILDYLQPPETFLNIHLEYAPILQISKHFWNTSTSKYRHPLSAPKVHPQIQVIIQRNETKMPRNYFAGFDIEILFSSFGIYPK